MFYTLATLYSGPLYTIIISELLVNIFLFALQWSIILQILLNFLVTVKAIPHKCVIRTGLL